MRNRPLVSIPAVTSLLAALVSALTAVVCVAGGHPSWVAGIFAGWLAGSLNAALLARRVSTLTARSRVFGFLYGMASRFALIAVAFLTAYRLVPGSPVGFAIGLSLVVLSGVPVAVWSLQRVPA